MFENLNAQLLDSIPGVFCIKDAESNYLHANKAHCKAIGFDNFESFINIGANDFNLRCPAAEMAHIFIQEDKKVITENRSLKILGFYKVAHDLHALFLGEKKPIYDESGNIKGLACHYQEVTGLDVINTFKMIKKFDAHIKNHENVCYYPIQAWNQFNLSPRQTECLYFLTRGFTIADIALQLQLSRRTVEDYINEIKAKLFCRTKKEIIDKAIHYGFLNYIPF